MFDASDFVSLKAGEQLEVQLSFGVTKTIASNGDSSVANHYKWPNLAVAQDRLSAFNFQQQHKTHVGAFVYLVLLYTYVHILLLSYSQPQKQFLKKLFFFCRGEQVSIFKGLHT